MFKEFIHPTLKNIITSSLNLSKDNLSIKNFKKMGMK